MDARELLTRLCDAIDARRWDDLPAVLHDEFSCRYVHTGETFDKTSWVRLNAEYPGFEHLEVKDLVSSEHRAVARCHVTGRVDGQLAHFEVASFISCERGLITDLTEVWADVAGTPPAGTRPVPAEPRP